MGVLDDAIREHLELKRKHGASDGELHQQEAEALGPARRDVPAAEPEADLAEALPAEDLALEPFAEEDEIAAGEPPMSAVDSAPIPGEPAAEPLDSSPLDLEPPPEEPLVPDPLASEIEEPGLASEEPVFTEEPVPEGEATWQEEAPLEPEELAAAEAGELEPAAGDTPPRGFPAVEEPPPGPLDQTTQEHPPPPPPGETDEADVLEETPDFLEETPEHDRLWFEQKPPRDFDF